MAQLVLPDPGLVILVGAAGSGKTTFAARHFAADEVLGSDAYRALIAGDEADQRATKPAFAALHRALVRRLAAGQFTVVDATNVEHHARVSLIRRASRAGVPAAAIVFDLPPQLVLERNAARAGRVVDPAIVGYHVALLRAVIDRGRIEGEGFDPVYRFVAPAEVDAATIVRAAAGRRDGG